MANYDINYDDPRFAQVESAKGDALSELENTYTGIIGEADKYYQAQIDASKEWEKTQTDLQNQQTEFNIEQIEQQKEQSHKDYVKEQSGAYVDWRKQSNQYGTEAEKMASAGLANTGFSESSQVSMYNTYQNRVATARDVYNRAVLNYDNAIKDARIQNNAALAEIAYQSLQTQLELSLQGFQYKNNLILEQANKKTELENTYYNRYLDVLNQINHENAMAEEIRQYNQNYELNMKQYEEGIRQFEIEMERLKKKDADEYQMQIKELELKKEQLEEEKRQYEEQMALKREQFEWEKAQAAKTTYRSSGGGGGSGNGGSGTLEDTPQNTANVVDPKNILDVAGPVSAEGLAQKVASGELREYTANGKTVFVQNPVATFNNRLTTSVSTTPAKQKTNTTKNWGSSIVDALKQASKIYNYM